MIDFYKKADEKRRGELEFVPEEIEEKFMLLLLPKKNKTSGAPRKKTAVVNAVKPTIIEAAPIVRPRVFCDAFYECV